MFSNDQIEELRNYFAPLTEWGIKLPDPKTVVDGTTFFLKDPETTEMAYLHYVMIDGKWYWVNKFAYGSIHVHDSGAGAQAIATGAAYTKLTCFTDNGFYENTVPSVGDDKITITKKGRYRVAYQKSFSSGTANITFKTCVFLNGVEQDQIHSKRKISNANDLGSDSALGTIDVTEVPSDVDLRMAHDNGGSINVTIQYAQLVVQLLGET